MKIEPKVSGWSITEYEIEKLPIEYDRYDGFIISLEELPQKIHRQETMNFILDKYRFTKCSDGWFARLDSDDVCKVAILENHPEYEEELKEYFHGERWLDCYLRFNH